MLLVVLVLGKLVLQLLGRDLRAWPDSRVILSNQKLVFAQLETT